MKKDKKYLNCEYLDAGMDGMLCSKNAYKTCTAFLGESCPIISESLRFEQKKVKQYTKEDAIAIMDKLKEIVSCEEAVGNNFADCIDVDYLKSAIAVINQLILANEDLLKKDELNNSLIKEKNATISRLSLSNPTIQKELCDCQQETVRAVFNIINSNIYGKGMEYTKKLLEDTYSIKL